MNDEIDLHLASADYTDAGNIKSDKWFCKVIDAEMGTLFNELVIDGKIKETHQGYNDKGVVVFTEEMTQTQAADYLNTVANFSFAGQEIHEPLCDYMNGCISAVCVVYPWPAGHTYPDGSPYVNGPAL